MKYAGSPAGTVALLTMSLTVAIACGKAETGDERSRAEPAAKKQAAAKAGEKGAEGDSKPTTPAQQMQKHFASTRAMVKGIVDGDLGKVHERANFLATRKKDGVFASDGPNVEAVRQAAKEVEKAESVGAAALKVADVAAACAHCHEAMMEPTFDEVPPPKAAVGTTPHMLTHQWAAERMWEGMVGPDADLWATGAKAFATAPLHSNEILENAVAGDDVVALAKKVHELGKVGADAAGIEERASAYGRFLATCAECHEAARRK